METTKQIFSPFDRTHRERVSENASIGSDNDGRQNDRTIRRLFADQQYGRRYGK